MKLLFISIALILQLWNAQGKQSHASFLNSRVTWAFRECQDSTGRSSQTSTFY